MSKRTKIFIGMLFFITILCVSICVFSYYYYVYIIPNPADFATPLPNNVVRDLCAKLEIVETDSRCQGNKEVYERDFYPDFRALIDEGKFRTMKDWQETFGDYLEECHEMYLANKDGVKPVECTFNFDDTKIFYIKLEFIHDELSIAFFLAPDSP